jgi:DUF971 family protein
MSPQPVELKLLTPDTLQIAWSDGQVRQYGVRDLREHCPCALCIERRNSTEPAPLLPVLKKEETQPLRIARMVPQGNYAYGIDFSDGHNTGLYTLETLRRLGTVVES